MPQPAVFKTCEISITFRPKIEGEASVDNKLRRSGLSYKVGGRNLSVSHALCPNSTVLFNIRNILTIVKQVFLNQM